jgi:hypothetical protein
MSDTSFERNFGQLVDTQINEKLPSLVPHRVGFQVIDKTDDETRAVGVAAFVVNSIWLYIPVFFLEGDLKGFELLYVKQKDVFVPAMDNWITMLSQQGIKSLGQGSDYKSDPEHNQMYAAPEDTNVYINSTTLGKTASDRNSLIDKDVLERMGSTMNHTFRAPNLMDIPTLGKEASQSFLDTFLNSVDFANSLFKFYTVDQVEKVATLCALRSAEKEAAAEDAEVQVITDINGEEAKGLDDKEKRLLVRNGIYVRDNRTNFSQVFHEEVDSSAFQNPTSPGIYDVFLESGDYKQMIILFPKCLSEMNVHFRQRNTNVGRPVAMIDPKKPTEYIKEDSKNVFVRPSVRVPDNFIEGLQGGKNATLQNLKSLKRTTSLLFVQSPACSIETELVHTTESADGGLHVRVKNTAGNRSGENRWSHSNDQSKLIVEFSGDSGKLRVRGDRLYVPEGTRVFTHQDKYLKEAPKSDFDPKTDELVWGHPETIYQEMHKTANLQNIKVHYNGGRTAEVVFGQDQSTGLVSKEAALKHLILDHGIYAGTAQQMLSDALRSSNNVKGFIIKHAHAYDSQAYGLSERPFLGGPSPRQQYATTVYTQTKGGQPLAGPKGPDNASLMPKDYVDKAVQASRAGIKEVFDVSVLQGLIDKSDLSELRKDYITDMLRGMDKIGRMLFLYYWHHDEFKERYGEEDLMELEETLREVFQSTGDLVLFLKEKTAYAPDSAESLLGNLSEDVATA